MPRIDIADVRALLLAVIDDERAVERLRADSPLYGALPDLDSIAVVNLMLAIEERFDVTIDDEDVEESLFATLGSLTRFVEWKVAETHGKGLPGSIESAAARSRVSR